MEEEKRRRDEEGSRGRRIPGWEILDPREWVDVASLLLWGEYKGFPGRAMLELELKKRRRKEADHTGKRRNESKVEAMRNWQCAASVDSWAGVGERRRGREKRRKRLLKFMRSIWLLAAKSIRIHNLFLVAALSTWFVIILFLAGRALYIVGRVLMIDKRDTMRNVLSESALHDMRSSPVGFLKTENIKSERKKYKTWA